jgi:hypothetical protein
MDVKRVVIKGNIDGSFELVEIEFDIGILNVYPRLFEIGRCPDCKAGGMPVFSKYSDIPGGMSFIQGCLIISHEKRCQAPIHKYAHALEITDHNDRKIEHHGPIFFLRSNNQKIPETEELTCENAIKYCPWLDCNDEDLALIAEKLHDSSVPKLPKSNSFGGCAIL